MQVVLNRTYEVHVLSRTCEIISRTFEIVHVCCYHEIPSRTRSIYIWYKRDNSLVKKDVSGRYLKYFHFRWNMKKNDTNIRVLFLLLFKQTVSNLFRGQPRSLKKRKQIHASSWHLLSKTTIIECNTGIWINFDTIWTKFYLFRCVKARNVSFYLLDYSLLSISHISRKKVDLK